MSLQPRRIKSKNQYTPNMKTLAWNGSKIDKGVFALQALEPFLITAAQIEAIRRVISRYMKREGQIWIRVFPDQPITKKPAEVRMGKGKGALAYWVATIKPGRILVEIAGVPKEIAQKAIKQAGYKLPVKTKIIIRRDYDYQNQ